MKVLIDTSQKDFFLSIIKKKKTITYLHKKNLQKKADLLPIAFKQILLDINVDINEIKNFYITIGPGSFTGSRTALVFARTICQITKAKLFAIDTLTFISAGIFGKYFLDAKSNKSYQGIVSKNQTILNLVNFQENSKMDYQKLIKTPQKYLNIFKEITNLTNLDAKYIKEPSVGRKK